MSRKDTGAAGEKLAQDFIKKKGYRIIITNYRCPSGEVDIIARQGKCLVFIEVRTKRGSAFGSPEESVTALKKRHLRSCAMHYLQTLVKPPESWRIDFIAVDMKDNGKPSRIEIFENAVGEA